MALYRRLPACIRRRVAQGVCKWGKRRCVRVLAVANRAHACLALGDASLWYVCVRGKALRSTVAAVRAQDRPHAEAALRASCREHPGYIAPVGGGGRPGRLRPGASARAWRAATGDAVVRVTRFGCDVEFWPQEDDFLHAPRPDSPSSCAGAGAPGRHSSRAMSG